jgi:hypothetical protein
MRFRLIQVSLYMYIIYIYYIYIYIYIQTTGLQTVVSMIITVKQSTWKNKYSAHEQWLISIVNVMCGILQYSGSIAVKLWAHSVCSVLAQSAEKQQELLIIMLLVTFPELASVTASEPNVYGILIGVPEYSVPQVCSMCFVSKRHCRSHERVRSRKYAAQFTTFNCDKSSTGIV